jgi:hypothetical protein
MVQGPEQEHCVHRRISDIKRPGVTHRSVERYSPFHCQGCGLLDVERYEVTVKHSITLTSEPNAVMPRSSSDVRDCRFSGWQVPPQNLSAARELQLTQRCFKPRVLESLPVERLDAGVRGKRHGEKLTEQSPRGASVCSVWF